MTRLNRLVVFVLCAIAARSGCAQGGPPMITDDPGTPGPGNFEINLAVAFEHRPNETSFDAPAIDLNYGVGERIQLTLQTAPVILKRSGHGPIGGLGSAEAALKWRFLDEEGDGISVSMFPRVIFNPIQSSVGRGLAADGIRVQLPFQVAKKFGLLSFDFESGALASTVGRSEWLYGVVGGIDLGKSTSVMAELHGTSRLSFNRDGLIVNIGLRQKLTHASILIVSIGREVRAPDDEPLVLVGYCGVQLLY